jgi:1-aminocyclopropane-1-carboxylate deaminase
LYALIKQGYFKTGQRIIALHTGGLQGNRTVKISAT